MSSTNRLRAFRGIGFLPTSVVVEQFEPRRLYSTVSIFADPWIGINESTPATNQMGVTVAYSTSGSDGIIYEPNRWEEGQEYAPKASTVTANLTGLPAHSMIRISVGPNDTNAWPMNEESYGDGDVDKLDVSFAGKSGQLIDDDSGSGPIPTGKLNKWVEHSAGSLSVSLTDTYGETDDGDWAVYLTVEVYQPTVLLGGGGTAAEDSGNTINFAISRDSPGGYGGTAYGDDSVPSVAASIAKDGASTASQSDFNDSIPGSITLTDSESTKTFSLTPIFDDDASESDEVLKLNLNLSPSYETGSDTANAEVKEPKVHVKPSVLVLDSHTSWDSNTTTLTMKLPTTGFYNQGLTLKVTQGTGANEKPAIGATVLISPETTRPDEPVSILGIGNTSDNNGEINLVIRIAFSSTPQTVELKLSDKDNVAIGKIILKVVNP